jgi:hypothetical protein
LLLKTELEDEVLKESGSLSFTERQVLDLQDVAIAKQPTPDEPQANVEGD